MKMQLKPLGSILHDGWERIYDYIVGEQTFEVTAGSGAVEYLVVAGGGGGGYDRGGGGGAGGYKTGTMSMGVGAHKVVVGAGGLGATSNSTTGRKGVFSLLDTIIADGGGGGGSSGVVDGTKGGSGGGGSGYGAGSGGVGASGQGNNGGAGESGGTRNCGGGGGAGAVGAAGTSGAIGNGGIGLSFHGTYYAGGGGGGTYTGTAGTGGNGGGGAGGGNSVAGTAGTANRGGGGGGGGDNGANGGNGGSGTVVIRYLTGTITATGGTITTDGEYTVHTFTTASVPVTSLTISGLNGDVDEEYILESKVVNGYNGAAYVGLYLNNDTGSNYGYQDISGINATAAAWRGAIANLSVSDHAALADVSISRTKLFAKTGFVRTMLHEILSKISTTTVTGVYKVGGSWNNSVNNLTSIVLGGSQAGAIGVGSSFTLYRKARRS